MFAWMQKQMQMQQTLQHLVATLLLKIPPETQTETESLKKKRYKTHKEERMGTSNEMSTEDTALQSTCATWYVMTL